MKINECLEKTQSFAELRKIVEKSQPNLSFFGSRYITVEGYEGTLPINSLAKRVLEIRNKDFEFDEIERSHGHYIVHKINEIHNKSELQIEQSNRFTWLLTNVQIIFLCTLDERGDWDYDISRTFELYTKQQFQKVFGHPVPSGLSKGKFHYLSSSKPSLDRPVQNDPNVTRGPDAKLYLYHDINKITCYGCPSRWSIGPNYRKEDYLPKTNFWGRCRAFIYGPKESRNRTTNGRIGMISSGRPHYF